MDTKAVSPAGDLGKMVDRVESRWSMPTVLANNMREKTIGGDKNGSDGVDVLDLSRNTLFVGLILLNTAVSTNLWCAEGVNLRKWLGQRCC